MKTVCIAALLMAAVIMSETVPVHAVQVTRNNIRPKHHQLSEAYSFEQYEADFNKHYATPSERQMRKGLFEQRLGEILSHNRAGRLWKKGVNFLTDRTEAERKARRGSLHPSRVDRSKLKHLNTEVKTATEEPTTLPEALDWRAVYPPVLTAIKDQGDCGSCWAHAATEGIESSYAIETGILNVLSQQQITACVANPNDCGGTGGCSGATPELAYDYMMDSGITEEWEYPYTAYDGNTGSCRVSSSSEPDYLIYPKGYSVTMPRNDPVATMKALSKHPLAIAVAAGGWDDYENGIYDGCDYANNITMDHNVQVVGWGSDYATGTDYWIVRNSWGAYWGDSGYIKLFKERNEPQCGWNVPNQDGEGCANGPTAVWSCGQCGILYDTLYPIV